jgi:chromate reductase
MPKPSFVAFAGSARQQSLNRKLLAAAVAAVREAGGEVTVVELGELNLPIYNGDLEEASGLPEGARKLVELGRAASGYLVATPEYNSSIPPLLKNAIDWMTRSDDDAFDGKVAAVVSASPGAFGAIRSATLVRQILSHIGCVVVPAQCTVAKAHEAFDPSGALKSEHTVSSLKHVAESLVRLGTVVATP